MVQKTEELKISPSNESIETVVVQEHTEKEAAHTGPHISIKAEKLFEINGFPVTNSLLTSFIGTALFIAVAIYYASQSQSKIKSQGYYVIQLLLKGIYTIFQSVLTSKIGTFFPLLGTMFFFILFNNWLGLLPGVGSIMIKTIEDGHELMVPLFRGATADLNTTIALALISVIITQIVGFKYLGFKHHVGKYLNFHGPIDFVVGLIEIVSEVSRILSFSFRLFGNILAGEVLISILAFLLPVVIIFIASPLYLLEIFVGFIQAFVFSMLTAIFINMAVTKHH